MWLLGVYALAQQEPASAVPDPQATLSINVKVVALDAVVHDRQGQLAGGLGKDAFRLRVDGKPTPIRYFNQDDDLPLTVGLLIDTSGSETTYFDTEALAGDTFLRDALTHAQDRAFIARFDSEVILLQGMTSDLNSLHNGLRMLDYSKGAARASAGTLLYAAIAKVSHDVMGPVSGRRALVVMTDGDDNGSRIDLERTIREAQTEGVAVYSVLFTEEDPAYPSVTGLHGASGLQPSGIGVMRQIAEATGGRSFVAGHGMGVARIFSEISRDLRSQYRFGFTPLPSKPGKFHKVELETEDRSLVVQTRKGYVTPEDGK
jgi:Ca-activated chloride channel family protein